MQATIGITTGDPAGIGLEVVLKSISVVLPSARWILFTDRSIFERNAALFLSGVESKWIDNIADITNKPILFLRDLRGDTSDIRFGERTAPSGRRALAYLSA
jgi:4-hydroxy-L-threonine phosphate dehydrogenase PdxA